MLIGNEDHENNLESVYNSKSNSQPDTTIISRNKTIKSTSHQVFSGIL